MAKVTATNKSQTPQLDLDEVYNFQVTKVEPAEDDGKFKRDSNEPREVVTLKVLDDDGQAVLNDEEKPIRIRKWITIYNPSRPRSAVYGMASALLFGGDEIPEGADYDTDDFVGKRGRFLWGMVHSLDGKTANPGIVQIMPPKRKAAATAVVAGQRTVTEQEIDEV